MKKLAILIMLLAFTIVSASAISAQRKDRQPNVVIDHVAGELPETKKIEGLRKHDIIDENGKLPMIPIEGDEPESELDPDDDKESKLEGFELICKKLSVVLCLTK
jgi:hypothetical protein